MGSFHPRPLAHRERALLDGALESLGPDAPRWRDQAARAVVVRVCECGCGTIDFGYPGEENPGVGAGVTVLADGIYEEGGLPFDVLLFAMEGRLSSLEIVPPARDSPKTYPESGRVKWLPGPHGT